MAEHRNDLGELNSLLFEELRRLEAVSQHDEKQIRAEVERARAIQGIAGQITASSRIVLDTAKLRAEWQGTRAAKTPAMLDG